ncbi:MAG TPA: hypothetical protein VKY89_05880 [Thermoanaerobaculia bacterium]|jgi:hypothetical protein|nr:hypothetical protein [Thermoanaerobaculia bacterium]
MPSEHVLLRFLATRCILTTLAVLAILGGQPLSAQGYVSVVSCPFFGVAETDIFHGIYITQYQGTNLSKVTLGYSSDESGLFSISLTARRGSFAGPMIGSTQTATVNLTAHSETLVTFDFGGAPVTRGDTITFTQRGSQLTSTNGQFGSLFFDLGRTACTGVFATQTTTPPLDFVVNDGVGIGVEQVEVPTAAPACVASDTVLCIDDQPGDQRFQVTASFHTTQAGGVSGSAQAIPLAQLGVVHGGLFWFFGADTPEMLFKVVNGCLINDRYWAFLSAATDVGFTVTVNDTALTRSQTYTNADLTAALPVQDTSALASCDPCATNADCRAPLICCFEIFHNSCVPPATGGGCPLFP